MSFPLTFLSASLPLTKTIERLPDGSIYKSGYPLVLNFSSETVQINNIIEMHAAILQRASSPKKPCLLKGRLTHELTCEPRKNTTITNDKTRWVCLDIDDAKFSSPDEVMRALGLDDISYVVQYSSSYKLFNKNLSCHIFFLLTQEVSAPELKAWLMHLNQNVTALESQISLSKSGAALHWPLDITTCQNDKLIYTAMPVFKGVTSPIDEEERIQLIRRKKDALQVERMELHPVEKLKQVARDKLNTLRVATGVTPLRAKTRMIGEYEVQTGVGEISRYEVFDAGEYNRLNLNGGDSLAYWHHKNDPTYLHNFKGEPSLLLKEVLPHYYADLIRNAKAQDATPTSAGEEILAFRDKVTAQYWKGTWNPSEFVLDLHMVKSELQLDHFLQSKGKSLGAFVPEYHMRFDPHDDTIVNHEAKTINTFIPTEYMRRGKKNAKGDFPVIRKLLDSAVGVGEVQERFVNWLAVVWQQRRKPLTAWVLHGTEGTGKGMFFHDVLRPLFSFKHAVQKKASELGSQFNGWLEEALIVFVDEIDADMFVNARAVEADLKTMITEPTQPIRRMRTDSYEAKNYAAFIFSSNKKRPVAIPQGDRRFNVGQFQPVQVPMTEEEKDDIPNQLEAFARFLSDYKADFNLARTVFDSENRREIQKLSITSVDILAKGLIEGDLMMLWEAMPDENLLEETNMVDTRGQAYATLVRRLSYESVSDLTKDELLLIFERCIGKMPEGMQKFTSYIRHHGLTLKRVRVGNHLQYAFRVEWKISPEDKELLTDLLAPVKKVSRLSRAK